MARQESIVTFVEGAKGLTLVGGKMRAKRIKGRHTPWGICWVLESPHSDTYPAGDPCMNDRETLVEIINWQREEGCS